MSPTHKSSHIGTGGVVSGIVGPRPYTAVIILLSFRALQTKTLSVTPEKAASAPTWYINDWEYSEQGNNMIRHIPSQLGSKYKNKAYARDNRKDRRILPVMYSSKKPAPRGCSIPFTHHLTLCCSSPHWRKTAALVVSWERSFLAASDLGEMVQLKGSGPL